MKKKILLFILLLIPFIVFAKENEVEITSVEQVDLSGGTTELSKSTYNGLEVNLNLRFTEVGDNAKYKVVIENNTNLDYELSDKIIELNSDYISYNASFEDNTNIIKANSSKILYVTISYDKEVEEDKYTNSKYTEGNSIVINLTNKEVKKETVGEILTNPNTGIRFSLIISSIGLLTGIIALLVIKKEKTSKTMMLLLITLLLIPITINAASKLFIKVNANVEIVKTYQVSYYIEENLLINYNEFDGLDFTLSMCYDKPIYVNSISEENKYTACDSVIWTDEKKYAAGDKVELKNKKLRVIANAMRVFNNYCTDNPEYTLCNVDLEEEAKYENIIYTVEYTRYNGQYGYKYNDNDIEIMNFSGEVFKNAWEDRGYIVLKLPNSFTMLDHDILFSTNYIE